MRRSPLLHPLAVLRTITGLSQKEFADLIGASTANVQAIELRKRRLTDSRAVRISLETGVDVGWLLSNRPKDPPMAEGGMGFDRCFFDQHRADVEFGHIGLAPTIAEGCLINCLGLIAAIMLKAHERGRCNLYVYKLQCSLKAIGADIGVGDGQTLLPSVKPKNSLADETVREFVRRFRAIVQAKESSKRQPRAGR
jgi:hypothetical protein